MKTKAKFKQTEIGMIPEDWRLLEIWEVAEVIGGGTPSTKNPEYWEGDIAWITPRDLSNFRFRYIKRGERNLTKKGLENSSAKLLPKRTVLLTTRAPVGYLAIADNEVTTNQGFRNLIPNTKTSSEFLFYLLRKNVEILKSNSTGTTFGELSGSTLKSLRFPFPPLGEQTAIAKILSDLDSKIELNQQMNKTLEAIGQAIFKHWFNSGDIPEDWKTKPLDEIAEFLNGLALQKYPAKEGESYLPVIKIRELRNGITEQTDKASLNIPKEYIVDNGDVLFSWSGTLEVEIWTDGQGALNQHLFKISSNEYPKWFYYLWTKHFLPKFRHIAEGKATTMGHIQRHNLSESNVIIPDKEKMKEMNEVMSPLIERMILLMLKSRNLDKIRDSLLPKLMSGKIRVPVEVRI